MRKIALLLLCFIVTESNAAGLSEIETGSIKGVVLDSNYSNALEYATISLINIKNDSIVNGTITDHSGHFKLENIDPGIYKLKITFIGYDSKIIDNVDLNSGHKTIDLGQIFLSVKSEELNEVVVVADQPTMSYKIDRKVIRVDQKTASSMGTAVNILENNPSINVDIDGTVSLRGSTSFTVLIDNKPTVLAPSDVLNQIPASTIKSIEIITNPSAMYSSEGISGIINIITKKDKLQGISGLLQANFGMYKNYGSDIILNFRQKKISFYIGANLNNRGIEGKLKSESWSNYQDTIFYLNSDGNYDRTKGSTSARGGFDFNLNSKNTISFQTNIGDWNSGGKTKLNYEEYTVPSTVMNDFISTEVPTRNGLYSSTNLQYTHNFNDKGHQLTTLLYFDQHDFTEESDHVQMDLLNDTVSGKKSTETGPVYLYNFQVDYALPFDNGNKFELGYKGELNRYNKQGELKQYDINSQNFETLNDYLYHVKFDRNIHAFYSLFRGEMKNFGYELGLRAEYTSRETKRIETNDKYLKDWLDFFPTTHFSYNFSQKQQVMASYTRRISRPKDWQLEDFYTWNDAYNLRLGNPNLKPQYIDSYEINFLSKWGSHSFSIDGYYKITKNSIETIQSIYEENIYLLTYENVGREHSIGIEISLNLPLFKWWSCNLSGNIYNNRLDGNLYGVDINKESNNWNGRLYNNFKVGKTTRFQLSAYYYSPYKTAQGDNQGYFMTRATLRQDFLKDFSASIDVIGAFGLLERDKTFKSDDFYIHNYIKPSTPIISFSISYKIRNYKYNRRYQEKNTDLDNGEGTI